MHNHRRRRFVLVAIAILTITILLLPLLIPVPVNRDGDEAKELVRITPAEFFSGELKRLKPHLDVQCFCFKIKTHGSLRCSPDVQMWCDGQRVDRVSYGYHVDAASDEITLSYHRQIDDGGIQYHRIVVGGMETFGRYIDEPKSTQIINVAFGPVTIPTPIELRSEHDSAIVWAVGTGRGIDLANPAEAEKELKAAPWALVLRVYAKKDK